MFFKLVEFSDLSVYVVGKYISTFARNMVVSVVCSGQYHILVSDVRFEI